MIGAAKQGPGVGLASFNNWSSRTDAGDVVICSVCAVDSPTTVFMTVGQSISLHLELS